VGTQIVARFKQNQNISSKVVQKITNYIIVPMKTPPAEIIVCDSDVDSDVDSDDDSDNDGPITPIYNALIRPTSHAQRMSHAPTNNVITSSHAPTNNVITTSHAQTLPTSHASTNNVITTSHALPMLDMFMCVDNYIILFLSISFPILLLVFVYPLVRFLRSVQSRWISPCLLNNGQQIRQLVL
jgi:cytoskeletal protein RodZ